MQYYPASRSVDPIYAICIILLFGPFYNFGLTSLTNVHMHSATETAHFVQNCRANPIGLESLHEMYICFYFTVSQFV